MMSFPSNGLIKYAVSIMTYFLSSFSGFCELNENAEVQICVEKKKEQKEASNVL